MSWPIAVVGAVVLILLVVVLSRRKKEPTLAERLGLVDDEGVLRGRVQGFSLAIEFKAGEKPGGPGRTSLTIEFPDRLGLGIMITKRQADAPNLRALATGDAGFDGSLVVEAREQKKALAYLTPERRECIGRLFGAYSVAWLNDQAITCKQDRIINDFENLQKAKDGLIDAAIELFPDRAARKAVRQAEKQLSPR